MLCCTWQVAQLLFCKACTGLNISKIGNLCNMHDKTVSCCIVLGTFKMEFPIMIISAQSIITPQKGAFDEKWESAKHEIRRQWIDVTYTIFCK